jgi:hypothetical protein
MRVGAYLGNQVNLSDCETNFTENAPKHHVSIGSSPHPRACPSFTGQRPAHHNLCAEPLGLLPLQPIPALW